MSRGRSWRNQAACAGGHDEWFPEPGSRISPLLFCVCAECPVWRDCLLFTLAHPDIWHGVWAGLTPHEIATLRERLLSGELGADVIEQARRITRSRGRKTTYASSAPHWIPAEEELHEKQRHVEARLRAVGLLDANQPRGRAA